MSILTHVGHPSGWRTRLRGGKGKGEAEGSLVVPLSQFSSVAQSCLTLCNPMNHSTPGLPVHHQLPEPTQTHVHWVSDAIQPSHPLSSPSPPALNLSQHQGFFPMSQLFASDSQSIGVSASTSVLPMNTLVSDLANLRMSLMGGGVERGHTWEGEKCKGSLVISGLCNCIPISQGEVAEVSVKNVVEPDQGTFFGFIVLWLEGSMHRCSERKETLADCEGDYNCYWETKAAVVSWLKETKLSSSMSL